MGKQFRVSNAVDVTDLAATTPYVFDAEWQKLITVQAVYTVTAVDGTIALQSSLDGATWSDFASATAVTATGSKLWDIAETKDARYWRVLFTRNTGDLDTLKIYFGGVDR